MVAGERQNCSLAQIMFNRNIENLLPIITESPPRRMEGAMERLMNDRRRTLPNDLELGDVLMMRNRVEKAAQPDFR